MNAYFMPKMPQRPFFPDPEFADDDPAVDLRARLITDPEYITRFLMNLEIYKFEDQYQGQNDPLILAKVFDDIGLVEDYSVDPSYAGPQPNIRREFPKKRRRAMSERLVKDRVLQERVSIMLTASQLEAQLAHIPQPHGPIILRQIDQEGFPTAYGLNPNYDIQIGGNPNN